MATKYWRNIGSVPADYDTILDWGGELPASGDTAVIAQGEVEIACADALPAILTFEVGYTQASAWAVPSSVLQIVDASLPAGVVIDNQSPGGTLVGGGNASVIGSLLLATGSVTSNATIHVGPGDYEDIAMKQDASSVPGPARCFQHHFQPDDSPFRRRVWRLDPRPGRLEPICIRRRSRRRDHRPPIRGHHRAGGERNSGAAGIAEL